MVQIIEAARPRILVNAAESGKKEKGSAVLRGCVMNGLSFFFGFNRHRQKPIRYALAQILLEKRLALDPVGIATQHQGAIAQERQDKVGDSVVISQQIPLRVTGLREIDLIQVAPTQSFSFQFNGDGFGVAIEQLGLNLGLILQDLADDLWRVNNCRSRGTCHLVLPAAFPRLRILKEREKNRMP